MKIIKIIVVFMYFNLGGGYAQQVKHHSSVMEIKFHYQHKKAPDSLSVWMYPKANYWDTSEDRYIFKDKAQGFTFQFPVQTKPLNYRLNLVFNDEPQQIGNYFAVAGDQVTLDVYEASHNDSLVFTGKGSAKYNLITKLLKNESRLMQTYKSPQQNASVQTLHQDLENFTNRLKAAVVEKHRLIQSAGQDVENDLKQIIDYQYVNYDITWINYLWTCRGTFKNSPSHQAAITKCFNENYNQFLDKSTEISVLSSRHYQYLVVMLWASFMFNDPAGQVDLKMLYNKVKHYSTNLKIKDRLLCEFFLTGGGGATNFDDKVFDSLARDASDAMISPLGKNFIETNLLFKKGAKLFGGEFVDLKGNKFKTDDLKGKVFLLDAWGEGCGGCVIFHNWFESNVWPMLKDNKDFVFLSVFDGKAKQDWERAINSKRYTSEHYLNVSTIPLKMLEHPFFKYYKVNYAPFLMLVDKNGNIIRKLNGNTSKEDLLALISKYTR